MLMTIPKESTPGERRVAASPQAVRAFVEMGFDVVVESGAGAASLWSDSLYEEAGARITDDPTEAFGGDVVLKVRPPRARNGAHEIDWIREGAVLVCFLWPASNRDLLDRLAARKASCIALDQVPRTTRAQVVDALSSMALVAGYRATIEAAAAYPGFFAPQMTAAGRADPARVFVIGAGVAGLAAIATARNLGARVKAFDVRRAAADQVVSVGGEFVPLDLGEDAEGEGGYAKALPEDLLAAERALFAKLLPETDVVITTALVPGKGAPVLITREMLATMRPGSVIVDLAAEQGGNCEATVAGEAVEVDGVRILGYTDLPSRMPRAASEFLSNNLRKLVGMIVREGRIVLDPDDDVVAPATVVRHGEITWPPPRRPAPPRPAAAPPKPAQAAPAPAPAKAPQPEATPARRSGASAWGILALLVAGALMWAAPPASLMQHLTVFVLACIVGWHVIWNVTPALHTPLMSVTNAISGIIVLGGLLHLGAGGSPAATWLGAAAVFVAAINIWGGFAVTQRMLQMFRRSDTEGSS